MDKIDGILKELQEAVLAFDQRAVSMHSKRLLEFMEAGLPGQPQAFCKALEEATVSFDFERTRLLCLQLVSYLKCCDNPYPDEYAVEVLTKLQRKRLFSEMLLVGDNLLQTGSADLSVKKMYAQALIDDGQYSAAVSTLNELAVAARCCNDNAQLAEAEGLLGRVYKQIYINAYIEGGAGESAREALRKSFYLYYNQYQNDKKLSWHGVNAIALWHRAKRDGISLSVDDISPVTTSLLKDMGSPDLFSSESCSDIWIAATAAEANLASMEYNTALSWLAHYVDEMHVAHNRSDAFEVASTLRQFIEVWQLNEDHEEQAQILQLLNSALLKRNGGCIRLANAPKNIKTLDRMLSDKSFEVVLGSERFKNLAWLKTGLECSQAVCKFVDSFDEAFGTGFLVRSKDLNLAIDNEWVVLTNAHVISNDERELQGDPAARQPHKSRVQFEASSDPGRYYNIDSIIDWSPRRELDYCVLTLKEAGDFVSSFDLAKSLPLLDANQRVYLIGHPRGGKLSFSLYDNLLLDHERPMIHYRSASQGGSSGSPVFNQIWELIGLHHAGGQKMKKLNGGTGHYGANEGIWIRSIIDNIESKYADKD